jgi:hypothetical protein
MISFAAPAEQSDRETCQQRLSIIAEDTRITARARNREHPKWVQQIFSIASRRRPRAADDHPAGSSSLFD